MLRVDCILKMLPSTVLSVLKELTLNALVYLKIQCFKQVPDFRYISYKNSNFRFEGLVIENENLKICNIILNRIKIK